MTGRLAISFIDEDVGKLFFEGILEVKDSTSGFLVMMGVDVDVGVFDIDMS
jgi:hypothetical protein